MSTRITVVGEALVDVVRTGDGVAEHPGGSPANVAITLARLGRRPHLVTAFGDDERGRVLRSWLAADGVDVTAHPSARTSTADVTLDAGGSAQYEFDLAWDVTADELLAAAEGADVLHTGSIATVLEPGSAAVEAALRAARGRALVSFDPNARPAITPDVEAVRSDVERFVGLADLVKVSEEDLAWYNPGTDPVDAARRWATQGPALVVVTLGGDGSVLVRGDDVTTVPGRRVEVADTIGAGDTYMGALLDALVSAGVCGPTAHAALTDLPADRLAAAAAWATAAAALTVSRPGADPPTRAELDSLLTHRS